MGLRTPPERGAALLTSMVAVAVLTAVATDLAYSSRVSLQLAANSRDELRATWRARGGVSLARMVLTFQQQMDDAVPTGAIGSMVPRIQLWSFVPVGALADVLFAGPATEGAAPAPALDTKIEDEGKKVNIQLEGLGQGTDRKLWQSVQSVYQLVCDAQWDPLFDREDKKGYRGTRQDLLVRLRDWVWSGDQGSALVVTGNSAMPCGMVPGQPPFEASYGDKNGPYDKGEDRYRTKNARMDSLDELYLVAGVGDAFMAAFREQLTVYLPVDTKRNVNEADRGRLVELARTIADPPLQPAFSDPAFGDRLLKAVREKTLGGLFGISPGDFGTLVQASGVQINAALLSGPNSPFTDRSNTYRIVSKGNAGAVESTVEAVVRLGTTQPGGTAPPLPTLIHWRED